MRFIVIFVVSICVAVLAGCVLGCGGLTPAIALVALLLGLVAGLMAVNSTPPADLNRSRPKGFWEWFTVVVFGLVALRTFCWMMIQSGGLIMTLSPNNLGDLSLHLTYIRYLASGIGFWPDNPIFAAEKLHYPLGIDLFNSLLLLRGLPVELGLVWVGLLGCLATGLALWRWGRAFAMAGFLFNGGVAGFLFFKTLELADFQSDLAWKSIPLSMLATQRGLLYAIPAGLLLLIAWRARFFPEFPAVNAGRTAQRVPAATNAGPVPVWVEILLYSTLPLFHLHTFLFLSFLLAIWFALGIARKEIAKLVGCALVPATVLVSQVVGFGGRRSLIHLEPGWMQGDQNFFLFWALNFGLLPLLVIALCVLAALQFRHRKASACFVLPATALFLVSCFVMFAPWPWDNTKLMIWCYLAVLPFLWRDLIAPFTLPIRILVCGALFLSGFVSLMGGLDNSHTGYEIASRAEIDAVASAVAELPTSAVFGACPIWNHPLLLNGRKLAVGYDGHLWSHGIDYSASMRQLELLMTGGPGWRQAARELNVRYLFWGQLEQVKWPDSTQPWQSSAPCVGRDVWGAIYDLAPVPADSAKEHATQPNP